MGESFKDCNHWMADKDLINDESMKEFCVAIISVILFLIILIVSRIMLKSLNHILKSRGKVIIDCLYICHILNILTPNLVTIIFIMSEDYRIVCSPQYLFLVLDHGLIYSITSLIFCKVVYMKMKSLKFDMKNVVGIFLTVSLFICISLVYFLLISPGNLTRTSYKYMNICSFSTINYNGINLSVISRYFVIYIGFLVLNHTTIWGAKKEMFTLLILTVTYAALKGLHHMYIPGNHFFEELLENINRIMFFSLNCFIFIWLYDDSKKIIKSVKKTDLFSVSIWNRELLVCFKNFLRHNQEIRLLTFFRNEFVPASYDWNKFKSLLGNVNLQIFNC